MPLSYRFAYLLPELGLVLAVVSYLVRSISLCGGFFA